MLTRVVLDDALVEEAKALGKHRTKTEAVRTALREYIQRRKQREILELFGTVDFDPHYDYKALRRRSCPEEAVPSTEDQLAMLRDVPVAEELAGAIEAERRGPSEP